MKRKLSAAFVILVGSTLGSTLVACGGSRHEAREGQGGDVVGWSAELDRDSPTLIDFFRVKSESYGCRTTTTDPASTVEQCPEGPITMLKDGRKVTVACKAMTFDDCHGLFNRITESRGAPSDD